jgi:hypothetical protein
MSLRPSFPAWLRGGGGWPNANKNAVGDCWVEPESHTFHYRNAVGNIGVHSN